MDDGLTLENLCISKDGQQMACLHAHVPPGTVLSVMGPSGAGKSTLLSALIGTLAPGFDLSGRVMLNGRDITALPTEHRHVGILFQDELLFPHLSVGGNLGFGLPASVKGRAARNARIEAALADIDMPGYAARDPHTLSGGQKARVALMRVLLSQPKALLLDEPFSRLDAGLRAQIRDLVFARARAAGLPVLLVTHDEEDARAADGPLIRLQR